TADMKFQGNRLIHGALIPQFVWISEDGEIRVAGQQLGKAFAASLKDPKFAAELGRYAAPELQGSGEPTKSSEVFSLGALLFTLVTGVEPPDATSNSAFANAVLAAKTTTGQPIPDDIRSILGKSLVIDAGPRYGTIGDMQQALSALAHGGKYSATTFNLAFYLSNLLKKEMESETLDREKEAKVNVAAYAETVGAAPAMPAPVAMPPAAFADAQPRKSSSRMGLVAAAAAVIVLGGGGGAWYMFKTKAAPAQKSAAAQKPAPAPMKAQVTAPALISSTPATAMAAATGTLDPAAQKKAFEAAVEQKLQAEMMKLQADYTKTLKQQQSKNAPVQTASSAPQTSATSDESGPSAAQLDSR